jgi:phenylpropionate dioxygenase-like ring-hydroxylating dioxygenase large terminal subunit
MTGFVASAALRAAWHPIAEGGDITDAPHAVTLLADRYVVWRTADGSLAAAPDRCPHREAPLSAGTVDDGVLTCPYHGWSFGDEGRCVGVPSSGEGAAIPPSAHLPCVRVEERYGLVWLCPGEPTADIPVIAHEDDPAFRRINSGIQHWSVSAPRMVDNFCDISHFPWVHTGTFGAGQSPLVPRIELGELDNGWFGYSYEVDANNPDQAVATTGTTEAVVHRHMSTGFQLPMMVRSTIRYEDGLEHVLLLCSTPVDDTNSLFTFVVWRNDDFGVDPEDVITFDRAIGTEDKVMLEQLAGTMPLERTGLVSVQADRASVEWRRRFAEMVGAGDGGDE